MSDLDRRMLLGAAGLMGVAALSRVTQGGPLSPPAGPVASTGKTLTEVEPRTLVSAVNTPGNGSSVFIISQPGSYYLGADLLVPSGKSGITINASNVTVDLNGFHVLGPAAGGGGSLAGIAVGTIFLSTITVRNGVVRQVGNAAVGLGGVTYARIEDVTASDNGFGVSVGDSSIVTRVIAVSTSAAGFAAIRTGTQCIVTHCIAASNGGTGISVDEGSVVVESMASGNGQGGIGGAGYVNIKNCTARSNSSFGIGTVNNCVVESCVAANNTGRGIETAFSSTIVNCTSRANTLGGILATDSSVIDSCTSSFNSNPNSTADGINFGKGCTVKDCTSNSNAGNGIAMLNGAAPGNAAHIRGCNAAENNLAGILAGSDSFITDNNCVLNGANGFNASSHLLVNGSRNRVERNNSTKTSGTGFGINVAGTSNLIYANSSTGSSINWNFGNVNVYGPIVDRRNPPIVGAAGSGNVPSTMATTDPFANITY